MEYWYVIYLKCMLIAVPLFYINRFIKERYIWKKTNDTNDA